MDYSNIESKPSLTIFFPAYNDENTIGNLVLNAREVAKELTDDYEIIVVDDCSPDRSGKVADELAEKYKEVKVIHHQKNKGYGGALKSGFYNATKDLVFYTDGDGQYDVKEIKRLFPYINQTDVVNGYKIKRSDDLHRIILGRLYHWTAKIIFNLKIRDVDCDFRLMRRRIFDNVRLESNSGVICVELMRKIKMHKFKIKEVPVHHYPRIHGSSQFFNIKRLSQVFPALAKLWWKLVVKNVKD